MTVTQHAPARAREVWRLLEPLHAVTYFSAEPLAHLRSAGYRGFWMGYFASRAAPLGRASAELVHALFHNFSLDHVARALPDAWDFAPPEAALTARQAGSVLALRRQLGGLADSPAVTRGAELAWRAASEAPLEGRPLYAANRALPAPRDDLGLLWHAASLLREHRGDGHVAALTAAGIGGREAHVIHSLATGTAPQVYAVARNLDPTEWASILAGLRVRGLVGETGALTAAGRAAKESVEAITDDLARAAYSGLTEDELDELVRALRPLTAAVVESGDIPAQSPMGLDLTDSVERAD